MSVLLQTERRNRLAKGRRRQREIKACLRAGRRRRSQVKGWSREKSVFSTFHLGIVVLRRHGRRNWCKKVGVGDFGSKERFGGGARWKFGRKPAQNMTAPNVRIRTVKRESIWSGCVVIAEPDRVSIFLAVLFDCSIEVRLMRLQCKSSLTFPSLISRSNVAPDLIWGQSWEQGADDL
ncbi:hypothetical protein EJ08DRAFT_164465 [Tothia fuscella]|uniref:Uncharacterized protein n=1 Tax=Tothia fuscella TaxID=1048955 RepID=A0A9P4NUE3_9PEZI|nr:hypothetical protein EJ08DRAFT_164465 [Tothia fuscella]